MGKILSRYLIVEVTKAFLSGIAVFVFLVLVQRMIELVDLIFARGVPGTKVAALFAYTVPGFLEIILPMAFLLSVVIGFSRMANDGELVALRASGISLYQMLRPVILLGALTGIVTFLISAHVRPWAGHQIRKTLYEITKVRATAAIQPRVFNDEFGGMVIYVEGIQDEGGLLSGVMLADERDSYRRTTSFATSGQLISDEENQRVYLMLVDGTSLGFHADQESYDKTDFNTLEVGLDLERDLMTPSPLASKPREMSWRQLLDTRDRLLAAGETAVDERIEIHGKFVIATASFLLAIVGVPLGMRRTRSVHVHGFSVTVAVVLIYYLMLSGAVTLARSGIGNVELIVWAPDIVLGTAGLWMLVRAGRERWMYPPLLVTAARALRRSREAD